MPLADVIYVRVYRLRRQLGRTVRKNAFGMFGQPSTHRQVSASTTSHTLAIIINGPIDRILLQAKPATTVTSKKQTATRICPLSCRNGKFGIL